jgi:hypothetical protein
MRPHHKKSEEIPVTMYPTNTMPGTDQRSGVSVERRVIIAASQTAALCRGAATINDFPGSEHFHNHQPIIN